MIKASLFLLALCLSAIGIIHFYGPFTVKRNDGAVLVFAMPWQKFEIPQPEPDPAPVRSVIYRTINVDAPQQAQQQQLPTVNTNVINNEKVQQVQTGDIGHGPGNAYKCQDPSTHKIAFTTAPCSTLGMQKVGEVSGANMNGAVPTSVPRPVQVADSGSNQTQGTLAAPNRVDQKTFDVFCCVVHFGKVGMLLKQQGIHRLKVSFNISSLETIAARSFLKIIKICSFKAKLALINLT